MRDSGDKSASGPGSEPPLSGIRVLDLSRIMAGPWAGQVLADLGADVIKVERPGVGDDTRAWGPPFLKDAAGANTKEAGYFLCVNRGKRSITVDISLPEGQEIIRKLAVSADILLENFKVGTLERLRLGYADLRELNPKLIYASVTGFGQTGPRSPQVAYDFMIQAMGGLMSVTGQQDERPGGGPQKVGVPIVDLMTGMYAAVAVLGALAGRERTGVGDRIDLAMLDVQVAFLANQAMNYLVSGQAPRRNGNSHPNIQPQDVYACSSGHIALAVGNDGQFARFCDVIEEPGLASDPLFATNAQRVRNLPKLRSIIDQRLVQHGVEFWAQRLDAVGVPCGVINAVPEVLADPQIVHRQMVRRLPHPTGAEAPQVVSPINYANAPLVFDKPPPLLGQHTGEVLRELGLGPEDIDALRDRGVI